MALTYFYLIMTTVTTLFAFTFSILMNVTFFKKRTLGSSFMLITFGMISGGEVLNTISMWLNAFDITSEVTIGILQAFFLNFVGLSIIYFYFFSTRHILRDNELIRSIIAVMLAEMIGMVTTLTFSKVLGAQINFEGVNKVFLADSNLYFYAPTWVMMMATFIPMILVILGRMTGNLLAIQRKITDPVSKRGTQLITISVFSMTISVTSLLAFSLPSIHNYVALLIVLQLVRLFSNFATMFFGYLGWVMPNWFKKRIRRKAWIVSAMKKREGQEVSYKFSSSNTIKSELQQIREVSDP